MTDTTAALSTVATTTFDRRKGTKLFRLIGPTPRARIKGAKIASEMRLRSARIPVRAMIASGCLEPVPQDEADALIEAIEQAERERIERERQEANAAAEAEQAEAAPDPSDPAPVAIDNGSEPVAIESPEEEPAPIPRKPSSDKGQKRKGGRPRKRS